MKSTVDASAKEPVLVMTRVFDAPRELVWEALTDPRHVAQWYGGRGFENPVCEMDVCPGGRWRHVMRTPDGAEHPLEFVFLEVDRPRRLAGRNADHGRPGVVGPHDVLVTVTLEEDAGRTRWVMVACWSSFADRDAARGIGFDEVLDQGVDKLVEVLAALAKGERFVLERSFAARPEDLWALFTTKAGFESWWGPLGFRAEVHALEARIGGALEYSMIASAPEAIEAMKRMGQPASQRARARFTELAPHARLALTHVVDFLPGVAPYESVARIELAPQGARTRLAVTLEPMHDPAFTKMAVMGWEQQLAKIKERFGRG